MNPLRRNAPPRPRGGGSRGVRRGAGARVGFPWLMPDSGFRGDAEFSEAQKVG